MSSLISIINMEAGKFGSLFNPGSVLCLKKKKNWNSWYSTETRIQIWTQQSLQFRNLNLDFLCSLSITISFFVFENCACFLTISLRQFRSFLGKHLNFYLNSKNKKLLFFSFQNLAWFLKHLWKVDNKTNKSMGRSSLYKFNFQKPKNKRKNGVLVYIRFMSYNFIL